MATNTEMTQARAREIWNGRSMMGGFPGVTDEERAQVNRVWDTMPGNSTWASALCKIANFPKKKRISRAQWIANRMRERAVEMGQ